MTSSPEEFNSSPRETIDWILPDAQYVLGELFDKSSEVISYRLAQLPFGTRSVLADLGVLRIVDERSQPELTSFGYDVAFIARQQKS